MEPAEHDQDAADKGMNPRPAKTVRRRRRQALTCETCRSRKVKCDRLQPCSNCIRALRPADCHYQAERPRHAVARAGGSPAPLAPLAARHPSFGPSEPPPDAEDSQTELRHSPRSPLALSSIESAHSEVARLEHKVKELERRLSRNAPLANPETADRSTSDFQIPRGLDRPTGNLAKAQYYGRSHWMHLTPLFPVIVGLFNQPSGEAGSAADAIKKCKVVGRAIKSLRHASLDAGGIGNHLPSREVCDRLVDAYFRTFETVYRILHAPTFYADYREHWENPTGTSDGFLAQLQAVVAIGACFHDDTFDMRPRASKWVQEAHAWSSCPVASLKSRLVFSTLQTMCLVHVARTTTAVGGNLVWISAGELVRTATYMGLHRDPDNLSKMPRLRAELRRRLWATIVQLTLQASIDHGGPAAISLSDFDTRPPSNFDDMDLVDPVDGERPPDPKPAHHLTQTSVQIALYRSFPTRLAIAQYLNDFRSKPSYDATLRLNADLTSALRAMAVWSKSCAAHGFGQPSDFQRLLVDHISHTFLMALHLPWKQKSQRDPRYFFSRKVSVETALRMLPAFAPDGQDGPGTRSVGAGDFRRLCTNGCGSYRMIPFQCAMMLGLELLWQREDSRVLSRGANPSSSPDRASGGPHSGGRPYSPPHMASGLGVLPCARLVEELKRVRDWASRRIAAGETNVRGHVMITGVLAQAESLERGDGDDEVRASVLQALMDGSTVCYSMLRAAAARLGIGAETATQAGGVLDGKQSAKPPGRWLGDGNPEGSDSHDTMTTFTGTPEEPFFAFGSMAPEGLLPGIDDNWTWEDFMDIQAVDFGFPKGSHFAFQSAV